MDKVAKQKFDKKIYDFRAKNIKRIHLLNHKFKIKKNNYRFIKNSKYMPRS